MPDALSLPPRPDKQSRRSLILLGVLAACVAAGVIYWRYLGTLAESSQAQVEGRTYTVTASSSGRIVSVPVAEGQDVRRGQLLVAMDDVPLRSALAEARAALDIARKGGVPAVAASPAQREAEEDAAQLAGQSRRDEQRAQEAVEHWTAEHARSLVALRSPASSAGPDRDKAVADEADSRQRMEYARRELEDSSRRRAAADATLRQVRQARDADRLVRPGPELARLWQSRVAQAEEALQDASALAPENGRVIWLAVKEGQSVRRGDALLTVTPLSAGGGDLWVTAFFDRKAMLRLRVGQICRVEIEDGPVLEGVIAALSPDGDGGMARVALNGVDGGVWPGQGAFVTVRTRSR